MEPRTTPNSSIIKHAAVCGLLITLGYLGLLCLLQAPAFWYNLRPDPIRSLVAEVFGPINQLFPQRWVFLERTHRFALISMPMYVAVLALISLPVVYLIRRLRRPGAFTRRHIKPFLAVVFGIAVLNMFLLLWQRGLLTSDVYSYVWYARIWMDFGASPYTHVPLEFIPSDIDGSIHWVFWQKEVSVYGPAWLVASGIAYRIGEWLGGSFSAQLLSFRLLIDAAHLLNAWLVWSTMGLFLARYGTTSRRSSLSRKPRFRRLRLAIASGPSTVNTPGLQAAALLFYIWNPLLLVEFGASGHNDVVMLTFVLLTFHLYLKGWWRLAAFALAIATLVKLPAIVFVPGFLWLLLWDGVRAVTGTTLTRALSGIWRAAQAAIVIVVTSVSLYAPFWEGTSTLTALLSGPANRMFLHTLAGDIWVNAPEIMANLQGITDVQDRKAYVESTRAFLEGNLRVLFLGTFVLVAAALTWRARTFRRALTTWGWLAIAAVLVQSWFWPWYVTWAVVPAIFAPSRRLRRFTFIFGISGLLLYLEEQIIGQHLRLFLDWSGILIVGPPLAYLLYSWLSEVRRKRKNTPPAVQAQRTPLDRPEQEPSRPQPTADSV